MNKKYGFEEDPRFKIATRESMIIWAFALIGPAIQVLVAELLGRGPAENLIFWYNLPAWIWLSFFIIPIAYISIMIYFVNKHFKDMPLDAYVEEAVLARIEKGSEI